ncbi:MAG: molecular chaperone DnaJ [Chloroflexota bacterium]
MAKTKRDYYETLGVDRTADESAIKKAYRRLAMQYHPDRNPGDQQAASKMAEINEAYAVLSDREKKRLYDTYGHAGLESYSTSDIFGSVDFDSLFREFGFGGGLFDSLFGGRRGGGRRRRRAADLKYQVDVDLEELAFGAEKTIQLPRRRLCSECNGTGARSGGLVDCDKCRGSGQFVHEQRTGYGVFRQISVCPACGGTGKVVKDRCEACGGTGVIEETQELIVPIPRGAETGQAVRIEGQGEAGEGGVEPGDLYVVLNTKRHPVFERHGDDIYMMEEIGFAEAALGAQLEDVPGLDGRHTLEVPPGTQSGSTLRIPGAGMPRLDGGSQGDEYVVVKVVTPQDLSDRQKELLREFETLEQEKRASSRR